MYESGEAAATEQLATRPDWGGKRAGGSHMVERSLNRISDIFL